MVSCSVFWDILYLDLVCFFFKRPITSRDRVLLCVSCVPASCFLIWFVSCPRQMLLFSLFLSSRVCLIVYDYPLYISPVCSVRFRLVYSLLPGVSCLSALSCSALMSWWNTIIWVYVLVCVFLFLPRVQAPLQFPLKPIQFSL